MGFFSRDKLHIIGFQGYGTNTRFYARGRGLEDENIDLEQKGFFALLLNTWKRFETDEVKHSGVRIKIHENRSISAITDNNGYYLVNEQLDELSQYKNEEGWLPFVVSFEDKQLKRGVINKNRFPAEMLIPSATSDFGVISDIDDTILRTGVVSSLKWRVIVNTVFKRAGKRDALEGTADFYHQLHRGASGKKANPIFYVSHSPWNLYRYLELFLKINNFPKGPILLRSISNLRIKNRKTSAPQKYIEIVNILETYPDLAFILIGDSGERDGDIYIEITKKFPGQVKAIYLRSVADKNRVERVTALFKEFSNIPFLLVNKTDEAIQHAKVNRFI